MYIHSDTEVLRTRGLVSWCKRKVKFYYFGIGEADTAYEYT